MGVEPGEQRARNGIDETLWLAVGADSPAPSAIESIIDPTGPLHRQDESVAIELWTERELGAIQALWRLAVIHGRQLWRWRTLDAARWHLEHTQPDNATNHPWAIPVFLDLWNTDPASETGIDARLYAETLLHNCQTQAARPDPLSALILLDAADGLAKLLGSD